MLERLGTQKHERALGEMDLKRRKLEQKTMEKQHQRQRENEQYQLRMMQMRMQMAMTQRQNQLPFEGYGLMAELEDNLLPPFPPFDN